MYLFIYFNKTHRIYNGKNDGTDTESYPWDHPRSYTPFSFCILEILTNNELINTNHKQDFTLENRDAQTHCTAPVRRHRGFSPRDNHDVADSPVLNLILKCGWSYTLSECTVLLDSGCWEFPRIPGSSYGLTRNTQNQYLNVGLLFGSSCL